jgi:hypothetical protein
MMPNDLSGLAPLPLLPPPSLPPPPLPPLPPLPLPLPLPGASLTRSWPQADE